MQKILCKIFGHLWIEWSNGVGRRKRDFIKGTIFLKNPECCRCGSKKLRNKLVHNPVGDF